MGDAGAGMAAIGDGPCPGTFNADSGESPEGAAPPDGAMPVVWLSEPPQPPAWAVPPERHVQGVGWLRGKAVAVQNFVFARPTPLSQEPAALAHTARLGEKEPHQLPTRFSSFAPSRRAHSTGRNRWQRFGSSLHFYIPGRAQVSERWVSWVQPIERVQAVPRRLFFDMHVFCKRRNRCSIRFADRHTSFFYFEPGLGLLLPELGAPSRRGTRGAGP